MKDLVTRMGVVFIFRWAEEGVRFVHHGASFVVNVWVVRMFWGGT